MLGDNIDINLVKYGVICIVSLLAFVIVFIFKLIFGSYVVGILIFVMLLWLLIFKIGITIMYPGSSNYFTSDLQIRIGNELAKNLHHLGHCFQFVSECVVQKKVDFTSSQWNLKQKVLSNIHSTIQMLSMFEQNLSERKAKILEIFRNLLQQLQSRNHQNSVPLSENSSDHLRSISQFLEHPKKIKLMEGQQHQFLCERMRNIMILSKDLQSILMTYKPPEKTFDFLKYKFMAQKLYEVRFGYQRWNHMFQYEVHLIRNYGYVLECAIIKKNRIQFNHANKEIGQQPTNGKYILFCNPNGVYIQFFAVQNTYIKQYLRQGYQIILWNYRGYGQSTGSPTITKSQSDAIKVYNYFTDKGLKIELVHGYSIGGCAAIGLVSKLQKKQRQSKKNGRQQMPAALRAQNLRNNVKLLIVDRSFSSIGDMAIQFGATLHKIAKVVFTFQNKNLSQQFVELKTKKLLLWDKFDEVIPDTASVKGGILMSALGIQQQSSCKSCSSCIKQQQQNALNQEVSVLINQREEQEFTQVSKKLVQRFVHSLKVLLKNSCEIDKTGETQLNANHEYDPSEMGMQQNYAQKNNQNFDITEQIANQVFNCLQMIDGGGSFLPFPATQLRKLLKNNPLSFQYKCQSYIVGLAYYGSVLPVQIAFRNKNQIQLHTLKKLDSLLKSLSNISDQTNQTTKILEPQLTTAIQNIKKTFTEIKAIVQSKFLLPQNEKFGKLIALNSGHNGSLPHDQLRLLMNYIGEICIHNQDLSRQLNQMNQQTQEQFSQNKMQKNNEIEMRKMSEQTLVKNSSTQNRNFSSFLE